MIFKNKIVLLFLFLMSDTITDMALAQECSKETFNWKKAGKLPDISPEQENPGYAGPVTGVFNNLLLVAGGANFPEAMPWMGGRKRHYDDVYLFEENPDGRLINIKIEAKLPSGV